ncbi:hypothetical protein FSP39_022980 [Pinctada imbricata]|uniref:Riboflavin transporter n=1 Tax=Pinctada imbricata TaxID=66713 RepID=A0AA88YFE2_PINIB|nr:hypothetical protein FSP39_022980 [Pinctada imbricata]
MAEIHCCWKDVDRLVFFFTLCFGIGSWITINGLWVELPSIVPHVPEGWTLPSYLSVIGQIANIGPITVTLIHFFAPGKLKDTVAAYGIIGIGAISCILLSFTWDTTGYIGGSEHSVALLVLVFFTSLADCTSSVVFIPFMSVYKPVYMTALYIGEGMSGLFPGFVALGQGVGQSSCQNVTKFNQTINMTYYEMEMVYEGLNFPVRDFFFFLCGMMVISGIGFTMLNFLPHCKKEQIQPKPKSPSVVSMPYVDSTFPTPAHALRNTTNSTDISTYSVLYEDAHLDRSLSQSAQSDTTDKQDVQEENFAKLSIETKAYLLLIIGVLSFAGNGLLSSTSTYSSLPYGEKHIISPSRSVTSQIQWRA